MDRNNLKRKSISFYGLVQGVGFRYHASNAASLYGVTGWVRNEYDGSVTMEAQGSEIQINDVINALENARYIQIDSIRVKEIPVVENERGFRVRY